MLGAGDKRLDDSLRDAGVAQAFSILGVRYLNEMHVKAKCSAEGGDHLGAGESVRNHIADGFAGRAVRDHLINYVGNVAWGDHFTHGCGGHVGVNGVILMECGEIGK